jgi:hypothetical protein
MRGAQRHFKRATGPGMAWVLVGILLVGAPALAVDVVPNGTFDSDLSSWTNPAPSNGTVSWDNVVYGASSGSMKFIGNSGKAASFSGENVKPFRGRSIPPTPSGSVSSGTRIRPPQPPPFTMRRFTRFFPGVAMSCCGGSTAKLPAPESLLRAMSPI